MTATVYYQRVYHPRYLRRYTLVRATATQIVVTPSPGEGSEIRINARTLRGVADREQYYAATPDFDAEYELQRRRRAATRALQVLLDRELSLEECDRILDFAAELRTH